MRFDRSSVSMAKEPSRSFPTLQESKVGNFQLAHRLEKSDKSAMPTVDQVRRRIQDAMDNAGDGAVRLAVELEIERNYLRDYLQGKKRSLSPEVLHTLAERYGIPISELLVRKEKTQRRRATA